MLETETALEAELTEHLGHEHGQTLVAASMRKGTGTGSWRCWYSFWRCFAVPSYG